MTGELGGSLLESKLAEIRQHCDRAIFTVGFVWSNYIIFWRHFGKFVTVCFGQECAQDGIHGCLRRFCTATQICGGLHRYWSQVGTSTVSTVRFTEPYRAILQIWFSMDRFSRMKQLTVSSAVCNCYILPSSTWLITSFPWLY